MSSGHSFSLPPKPLAPVPAPIRSAVGILSGGTKLGGGLPTAALPSSTVPTALPFSLPPKPTSQPTSSGLDIITKRSTSAGLPVKPVDPALAMPKPHPEEVVAARKEGSGSPVIPPATSDPELVTMKLTPTDNFTPSHTALGKRKASDETPSTLPPARSDRALSTFSAAPTSSDTKPVLPVPMLPLPLPSKRFKKSASSKAVLIPVEQLPVYPLPPPPPIRDPALAKQVFIHSSCLPKSRSKFEDAPERPTEHYEKLEHVGDSILGMVVTAWLHEVKPGLSCGTASKLKAHLVSNATLSHISGMYNFPQKLQGDPHILPVLRAQTDVRAAMMEAYIAALYFSFPVEQRLGEGIRVIDAWLREMYEPLFDFFYDYMKSEYEQHHLTLSSTLSGGSHLYTEDEIARIDTSSQGMANLLKMYCYRQDRELHFEEERYETHCGILWRLKCLVDGIEVGEATRSGRKVAKNVAAWEACRRLGLVKEDQAEEQAEGGEKGGMKPGEAGEETAVEGSQ